MKTALLRRIGRRPVIFAILLALLTAGLVATGGPPLSTHLQAAKADVTAGSVVFVDTRSSESRIAIRTSDGTVTDLTSASEYALTPDVSADGSRIAFAAQGTCVEHPTSSYPYYQAVGLKVMNSDGSNEVWLTQPHCDSGGSGEQDSFPRWSPDGTQVAYVHEDSSSGSWIYKVDADGTGVTQLTTTGLEDHPPSWSPDGSKIAFDTYDSYYPVLYVMDASDGGNKHLVSSTNTGNESRPTWAPSGNRIYFVASGGFGYYDSSDGFASAESLTAQSLTGGSASGGEYDLSTDGSTLLYRAPDGSTSCGELWTLDVSSDTATEVTSDTCSSGGDPWYITPRYVKASWSMKHFAVLGDSYSSGEGVPDFISPSGSDGCDRSDQAYAKVLDSSLPAGMSLSSGGFVACSGATSAEVINGKDGESGQLGAISSSDNYVILTVGGNDIGFDSFVTACVDPLQGCAEGSDAYTNAEDALANLPGNLSSLFGDIRGSVSSGTRVLVLGYPEILPPTGASYTCSGMSSGSQTGAQTVEGDLNAAIHSAVESAGAPFEYVDSFDQFDGHQLCSSDPYFRGLSDPTKYSYHPNAEGQAAYAQAVYTYLIAHPTAP